MTTLIRIHLRTQTEEGIAADWSTWASAELPPPVVLANWKRRNRALAAAMVGWECVTPRPPETEKEIKKESRARLIGSKA